MLKDGEMKISHDEEYRDQSSKSKNERGEPDPKDKERKEQMKKDRDGNLRQT